MKDPGQSDGKGGGGKSAGRAKPKTAAAAKTAESVQAPSTKILATAASSLARSVTSLIGSTAGRGRGALAVVGGVGGAGAGPQPDQRRALPAQCVAMAAAEARFPIDVSIVERSQCACAAARRRYDRRVPAAQAVRRRAVVHRGHAAAARAPADGPHVRQVLPASFGEDVRAGRHHMAA